MTRVRTFRRSHLADCHGNSWDWLPAETDEGRSHFTTFSAGHGEETLVELRPSHDYSHELAMTMQLRS